MFRRTLSVLLCICMLFAVLPATGMAVFASEIPGSPVSPSDPPVSPSDPPVSPSDPPVSPSDPPAPVGGVLTSIAVTGMKDPLAGKSAAADVKVVCNPDIGAKVYSYWLDTASKTQLADVDKFAAGRSYMLTTLIVPSVKCELSDQTVVTLNGSKDLVGACVEGEGYISVSSKIYTCSLGVDSVEITGAALPKVGAVRSDAVRVPAGSKYSVTYSTWMCYDNGAGDPRQMKDGETFKDGNVYFMYLEVTPEAGYTLGSAEKYTINGYESVIDTPYLDWDGKVLTIYTVDFDFREPASGVTRVAGDARQQTAVEISKETYPGGAENVILASGDNYADALAGVPLAYAMKAPILLVRANALDPDTVAEIQRLGAKNVCILGGTSAISAGVANELISNGYSVSRISGSTRFDTAVEIAKKLEAITGKKPTEAFFAYSHNYPDALAVSNIAAMRNAPVFYTPADGNIGDAADKYLSDCGTIQTAYIIGGYSVIKDSADSVIIKYGAVKRVYGEDRYSTCLAINTTFADCFEGSAVCVATGTNYPDALAGGVLAAAKKAPMLLTDSCLPTGYADIVSGCTDPDIYVFGGTSAVPNSIANMLVASEK